MDFHWLVLSRLCLHSTAFMQTEMAQYESVKIRILAYFTQYKCSAMQTEMGKYET